MTWQRILRRPWPTVLVLASLSAGCGGTQERTDGPGTSLPTEELPATTQTAPAQASPAPVEVVDSAVARLQPVNGSGVTGVVTFLRAQEGVRVKVHVVALEPGTHGFHIHEFGDCSTEDGSSAGGHFNPHGHEHGGLRVDLSHVGDLGNLVASDKGLATASFVTDKLSLDAGPESILGRGVIVHALADDLKSQPTGAAGPRVACGVIMGGSYPAVLAPPK